MSLWLLEYVILLYFINIFIPSYYVKHVIQFCILEDCASDLMRFIALDFPQMFSFVRFGPGLRCT
jgi:hypothetical protein